MLSANLANRGSAEGESGQVIVLMALFLSLVGLAIVGTVLDFGLLAARNSAADAAAYLGAQAGGGMVNDSLFASSGTLALIGASGDSCTVLGAGAPTGSCYQGAVPTAAGACAMVAAENDSAPKASVTCVQRGLMVTATVQQEVAFPVSIFGVGGRVNSTRQAGPAYGTNHAIPLT